MEQSQWMKFTDDFDYEKRHYDVLLPTGEIVLACWPNAGKMVRTYGHGRGVKDSFSPADEVSVRISKDTRPWRKGRN